MTDTFGSYVGEAYGSVHTGPGNQFNFYLRAAEERLREQASRRPRAIAKEDREHLAKRFVNPPHMQRARDRLREKHTVLIDGRPGSGRRTAAIMLLHELSEVRGTLHELPDTSDDSTASPLDPVRSTKATGSCWTCPRRRNPATSPSRTRSSISAAL